MTDKQPHHIGTLSPEMALLGLLYKEAGHGYDLHRTVNTDLGHVWHLSQSQAYAILKRLEAQGDVSVEKIPQEKLPSRQLLQMTEQGRENFLNWLNAPSGGSTRAIRMEFITRLYFLKMYFPKKNYKSVRTTARRSRCAHSAPGKRAYRITHRPDIQPHEPGDAPEATKVCS